MHSFCAATLTVDGSGTLLNELLEILILVYWGGSVEGLQSTIGRPRFSLECSHGLKVMSRKECPENNVSYKAVQFRHLPPQFIQ